MSHKMGFETHSLLYIKNARVSFYYGICMKDRFVVTYLEMADFLKNTR